MNILLLGLNYAPEPVGIGPYTHDFAVFLAKAGHDVTVVCGKPYYPAWKTDPAYAGGGSRRTHEDGVEVIRLPIYVPAHPTGSRRLIHHASFGARALPTLIASALRRRPDVIIGIAPSLISLVGARFIARLFDARLWIHFQDFELEAAFATGLLEEAGPLARLARAFERWSMRADRISAISPQMCAKLAARGIDPARIVEFRNWADVDRIRPLAHTSTLRGQWNITRRHVALYSGNIANKQGIEIVVAAARRLAGRSDLQFVVCGDGPSRKRLHEQARDLDNIQFHDLQPAEMLPELLGLATVHMLPQIAGAADLVLPSKLTNMLASGRPIVATADPGTGLAIEVEGCGVVTPPGDAVAFADAIEQLIDSPEIAADLGRAARSRAEQRWSRAATLEPIERALRACVETG